MPGISEFYGIVIWMYVREHPPPHFHAWYSGDVASISIATDYKRRILKGPTLSRA